MCGYAAILLSSVRNWHCKMRAVATSNWSAGSRWKGCGSCVDSTTIRGWSGRRATPGCTTALSNHSPTLRSRFSLPYSTSFAVPWLQPVRPGNPPNPDVGVQDDHNRASQSSLATGSSGSLYWRTDPRRSPCVALFEPAVFEITSTSTHSPGSKGSPLNRTSPCSPTVVSPQCDCTSSV